MTFSGDHLEEKSNWSRTRSRFTLIIILATLIALVFTPSTRSSALVGIALLATIMFHEAGHFIAAKWSKMKATEFFVGFGPRIWSFHRGETEYGIKSIPLGGYVKIIGMTELEETEGTEEHRTYRNGKTHKKLIVILAGVTVNAILAFLLIYSVLVFKGVPVEASTNRAVIEASDPGSPSYKAGLRANDEIIAIGDSKISSFDDLIAVVSELEVEDETTVTYLRDGKERTGDLVIKGRPDQTGKPTDAPYIGVTQKFKYERVSPVSAVPRTFETIYRYVDLTIGNIMNRFSASGITEYSGIVADGDYERQDRPSSVAGIVNLGGQAVDQDIWKLLWIVAVINIFLALFNLLPILPLDGGHAAVAIYEWTASKIMRRPIKANHKRLIPIATAFIGLMLLLSLSTLWLDVLQIKS